MKKHLLLVIIVLCAFEISAQSLDSIFSTLKYRNIGPFRGGRSVSAAGVVQDPLTYYMGTTGGGLWKTADAGQRWTNISDGFFKTGSVGAVAVSESNPNVVYCGMGEHAPRGVMTSYGDGVYKSTDAGKTWKHVGLKNTQHIARIVIHPQNPDVVYVAAQGALYGPNPDRGIYKSTDGGTTWAKVLFVNNLTGCSELSMDMNNPLVLYAAMWHHQRKPWQVVSGGSGSGLYKSTDGGATWNKMHQGLPKEMGKMAIAVCRSNSERVYALIESDSQKEQGGLFVSTNGGDAWSKVSSDHRLVQRAWYYIEVFPDPVDEHTVYVLSAPALRSIDGGKSWERITGTHGDFHDLWINHTNPQNMVIANDGGAAITFNRGATWSTQSNMPTAQFYRVNVDNLFPYNIYGGQQDNTSVKISSLAQGRRSIGEQNWTYSAGGESAFLAFDPNNPQFVMGGSYLGTVELLNSEAKAGTRVMAAPIQYLGRDAKDMRYRFNWNAPIIWSQHEPNTFYHAAQKLLRTRDRGISWEEISDDLSRNEIAKQGKGGIPYTNEAVGAENYGTISYVKESPYEQGTIWVGTDDGLVQLTRDGGETWQNVTPKGLTECLVNAIEISPHDAATAYIATTRYKFNDYTPAIYKTSDYGKSWINISRGIPYGAFTRVVREDEKRKDLLFAGTETGLYISWNGGAQWQPFQLNLPVTPITDLITRHGDLVIATAGRSFWVLDDLGLLQQYNGNPTTASLYAPEAAMSGNWGSPLNQTSETFKGTNPFQGVNPAHGMVIYYQLPEDSLSISLEIKDQQGRLIRKLSNQKDPNYRRYAGGPPPEPTLSNKKGLNRFVWDLRHAVMPGAPTAYIEGSFRGHKAIPGSYQLKLDFGSQSLEVGGQILANPTYGVSPGSYQEYDEFMSKMEADFIEMHQTVNQVLKLKQQLTTLTKTLDSESGELKKQALELIEKMKSWDEDMIQRKSKAYDDVENFPNKFTANFLFLINQTESAIPAVNQPSRDRYEELSTQWEELKKRAQEILKEDIPAFNEQAWKAGIGAIKF